MAQRQNATHAFVLQTRDPKLCSPVPPRNVSAWDARPLNTRVVPAAFERALAAAACASGRDADTATRPRGRLTSVPSPVATAPFEYGALHSVFIDNGRAVEERST